MNGTLFVVATPIGNLEDLPPRACQTLAAVDLIAAEDTRRTRGLLSHFGIKSRLFALHEHNERQATEKLIKALRDGKSVALVSDAGTPLVSDPGYRLIQAAHRAGITVSPVPGASAVTAALSVAGLPTHRFTFEGFLPAKRAARRKALESLANESRTMVFYEAVHRLDEALADLVAAFGDARPAFLGRELTKLHEQCVYASLGELQQRAAADEIPHKGEFVIVVGGAADARTAALETDRLLRELAAFLPAKDVAKVAARVTGGKRNELYQRILSLTGKGAASKPRPKPGQPFDNSLE